MELKYGFGHNGSVQLDKVVVATSVPSAPKEKGVKNTSNNRLVSLSFTYRNVKYRTEQVIQLDDFNQITEDKKVILLKGIKERFKIKKWLWLEDWNMLDEEILSYFTNFDYVLEI